MQLESSSDYLEKHWATYKIVGDIRHRMNNWLQ